LHKIFPKFVIHNIFVKKKKEKDNEMETKFFVGFKITFNYSRCESFLRQHSTIGRTRSFS